MPIGMNKVSRSSKKPIGIPDSAILHIDATEETASGGTNVSTLDDISGENNDLTAQANAPQYVTDVINGQPVYRFDRSNNEGATTSLTTETQPIRVYMVASMRSLGSGENRYFFDDDANSRGFHLQANSFDSPTTFQMGASTSDISTDVDEAFTRFAIFTLDFDGTDSEYRVDGSTVSDNFDAGSRDLDGIGLARRGDGNSSKYGDCDIGEFIIDSNPSNDRQSVEQLLADKWGITI